eukprot:s280_g1.t3
MFVGGASCLPKTCNHVPSPLHADAWALRQCQGLANGSECALQCEPGYLPTGSGRLLCHLGNFQIHGHCKPADCLHAPSVRNSLEKLTSCVGLKHGSACDFECRPGYKKVGWLQCFYGRFTSARCEPGECKAPPVIPHLPQEEAERCAPWPSGKRCNATCSFPRRMLPELSCSSGHWSSSKCVPYSDPGGQPCRTLPVLPRVADLGHCTGLPHGAVCKASCIEGYSLDRPLICLDGLWSQASCEPLCRCSHSVALLLLLQSFALGNPAENLKPRGDELGIDDECREEGCALEALQRRGARRVADEEARGQTELDLQASLGCYEGSAPQYYLNWEANASNFFKDWTFVTHDPSWGAVNYLKREDAKSGGLLETYQDHVVIRTGALRNGKRDSVRIQTNKAWNPHDGFLVAMKYRHVPYGAGVWPAFWTMCSDYVWPKGGELDILEFANDQPNLMTFHTLGDCAVQGRSRSRDRLNESARTRWISKILASFGRYTSNRPRGLRVCDRGSFSLTDLMETWGHREGVSRRDILHALRVHMFHEDQVQLRFELQQTRGDTIIRVMPKRAHHSEPGKGERSGRSARSDQVSRRSPPRKTESEERMSTPGAPGSSTETFHAQRPVPKKAPLPPPSSFNEDPEKPEVAKPMPVKAEPGPDYGEEPSPPDPPPGEHWEAWERKTGPDSAWLSNLGYDSIWMSCDTDYSHQKNGCKPPQKRYNGDIFNSHPGTMVAEWNDQNIKIWHFPAGTEPADLFTGAPRPATWDPTHLQTWFPFDTWLALAVKELVINTDLCGQFAGNTWELSPLSFLTGYRTFYGNCKSGQDCCEKWIQDPRSAQYLRDYAFWDIDWIKVFTPGGDKTYAQASGTSLRHGREIPEYARMPCGQPPAVESASSTAACHGQDHGSLCLLFCRSGFSPGGLPQLIPGDISSGSELQAALARRSLRCHAGEWQNPGCLEVPPGV